jgi:replicative DNA helicase
MDIGTAVLARRRTISLDLRSGGRMSRPNSFRSSEQATELLDASEAAVLGSMALSPDAIDTVVSILHASDFLLTQHGLLFSTMSRMRDRGQQIDAITLCEQLVADGMLAEVGGVPAIGRILETVPHAAHARYYAEIVLENSRRRKFRRLADEIRASSEDRTVPVQDLAGQVTSQVDRIFGVSGQVLVSGRDAVADFHERMKNPQLVIPTGLRDLDAVLDGGGLGSGLVIACARPSMGKTSWLLSAAMGAGRAGVSSLIFSMEMPIHRLIRRVWKRGDGAEREFEDLPIFFNDTTFELNQIKSVIRQSIRRDGTKLFLCDYLDFIAVSDKWLKGEDKIREITIGLKRMASEHNICIVLLCQLNRKTEDSEDKRPKLTSLRNSGSLEQDADLVIGIHRPSYYDSSEDPNLAELLLLKQRDGDRGGIVKVGFRGEETQFVDYAQVAENVADGFDL